MGLVQNVFDAPTVRRSSKLRTFLIGAWLGWQIESNWADPFLFTVYSIARPVASVLILVVMYNVITNSATQDPAFAFIYVGNALYILVGQLISGVSMTVIEDREHYRVAKQLYTTPMDGYYYLLGRGMAKLLIGFVSVVIVLVFGGIAFQLPLNFADVPLLLVSTLLGIISLGAMGLMLGSLTMSMARHFWSVGEAVGGALYIFAGALFPIGVLPDAVRWISYVFPITYWLELARRGMLGVNTLVENNPLSAWSNLQLLGVLSVMTAALVIASVWYYEAALTRAKDKGLLDMESGY